MSPIMDFALNTVLITIENVMLYLLVTAFFPKKWSDKVVGLLTALAYLAGVFIFFVFMNATLVKRFLALGVYFAWIYFSFKSDWVKRVFVFVFWLGYLMLFDNVFVSAVRIVFNMSYEDLLSNPYGYYILCISIKILETFGIVIIRTWIMRHFNRDGMINSTSGIRFLVAPFTSLTIAIFLTKTYFDSPNLSHELLLCLLIVLFSDIVSIFLLNYLETQSLAVRGNIILRQGIKSQMDSIESWKDAYEGQRKITHDFKNQLAVLQGMIENNAPKDQVINYLDKLQNVNLPTPIIINTHRMAMDIILSQKLSIAESKNIKFGTQLDDLSKFPLPDEALVIVMANLIDNAIESCEKIPDKELRYIQLKIKNIDGTSFLYIENSTGEPVKIDNNRIVTRKNHSIYHGYGLQNIFAVLDKYNAIYSLDYVETSNIFSFSAQITDGSAQQAQ